VLVILIFGRIAERLGPGRVTVWGGIITALSAWPLFALIDTRSPWAITIAVTLGIAFLTITYAVTGALLSELFPPQLRYSGVSLGYNIAGAMSGFLPFVATWMIASTGTTESWPAVVILAAVALTTAAGGFAGERLRIRDAEIVHSMDRADADRSAAR
jgi:MFS family permease